MMGARGERLGVVDRYLTVVGGYMTVFIEILRTVHLNANFRECTQHLFFKRKRRKRRTQYYVQSLSDHGLKEEDGKTAGEIQTRTMSWII